ncbi:MAG: hypothetical protein GY788_14755 [bacterium]|nr:hypothetical protein [bacterium]
MDYPHSIDLAHRIADAITDRTGRVWDEDSRIRLAFWLDDPDHQAVANRWLTYVGSSRDVDGSQAEEFALRRLMDEALAGSSPVILNGFASRTNRRLWWRRRTPNRLR